MTADSTTIPIIRTKPHRPPVTADIVYRVKLHKGLEASRHFPFTLVSAPAIYFIKDRALYLDLKCETGTIKCMV